jgi:hypothetical protein
MPFARLAALSPCLVLAGCAAVTTLDGQRLGLPSEEFRGYVERVFREQNRVADELAFALEGPGGEATGLAAAEAQLLAACSGVNELATARRDERRLGMRRSLSAARSVPQCEGAARAAERALAATSPP